MKTDNQLIVEFMGGQLISEELYNKIPIPPNQIIIEKTCRKYLQELEYHTSWDWLMTVVEKISKDYSWYQSNDSGEWQVLINIADVNIVDNDLFKVTYKAVVEYIKWYNQQKA
jgi:hypothetical protein